MDSESVLKEENSSDSSTSRHKNEPEAVVGMFLVGCTLSGFTQISSCVGLAFPGVDSGM